MKPSRDTDIIRMIFSSRSPPQFVPGLRSLDTVLEVKNMVDPIRSPDKGESTSTESSARYRKLPERIRPEDMIATQETEPPSDPTMGRDPERDFMLRNAGF